ncbi:MAG: hypothetical protein WCK96_02145 [Methylococcales bacterium]
MTIPFEIPPEIAKAIAKKELMRYGAIVKDVKTGIIKAHLRESKNLVDQVGNSFLKVSVPMMNNGAEPITALVTGLVDCASSLAANYQLHQQGIKIDYLTEQVKALTGLAQFTAGVSAIGAVASLATFALCASKFKAIDNRLNIIETKFDDVLYRLESLKKDAEKREIRGYLSEIKGSFDYLLPNASQNRIENVQLNLSKGFSGLNGYLQDKIQSVPEQLDLNDIVFLYNTLMITAMGEFRGFIILNDIEGAKHILKIRKSHLNELKKSFSYFSRVINSNHDITKEDLVKKSNQFELLVNNVTSCYADFNSQNLIVSEYIEKKCLSLKGYYENIENNDSEQGIIFVKH